MSTHPGQHGAARQAITPELRRWIIEQVQAGFAADAVLGSMRASGWQEDVAVAALETTLRDFAEQQARANGLPPASPVPEPPLDESPLYVDAGDRRVPVLSAMFNPRVVVFGSLLSDEECDALIAAARPRMARSMTVATKTGGEELNDSRTSNGMFFQRGENEVVSRIEARIARLVNWPVENGEG
ncbi:MAG: 2-oxoglutarate-dependent dioxygenase, partial [Burkholderiaceae bacterium]